MKYCIVNHLLMGTYECLAPFAMHITNIEWVINLVVEVDRAYLLGNHIDKKDGNFFI